MPETFDFDGATYEPDKDRKRLSTQLVQVFELMRDGLWRTIPEIVFELPEHPSDASVSARLRDLRKARFGAHTVERKRVAGGLYAYRLVTNGPSLSPVERWTTMVVRNAQ